MRFLRLAFRPVVLIGVSMVLVGVAVLVTLLPEKGAGRPRALPLGSRDQEIAFLYPATSTIAWARFVQAVEKAGPRLQGTYPGLYIEKSGDHKEGRATASGVPEVVLHWPDGSRLLFRWYKLTDGWKAADWAEALVLPVRLGNRPPPVAIVSGSTSEWASKIAFALKNAGEELPQENRPLLLLTTATADQVVRPREKDAEGSGSRQEEDEFVSLTGIYAKRTFRFGFTNRQMATAVTRFLWSRPDLRPDSDPAVLMEWLDDSYSRDLYRGYTRVLPRRANDSVAEVVAGVCARVAGCVAAGLPAQVAAAMSFSAFRFEDVLPLPVDSSVGSFSTPNSFEAGAINELLKRLDSPWPRGHRDLNRRLLVLTGQAQPVRRTLRDLARSAPDLSRRLVVTVGDAVSFNAVYRDREVTWPVQDLPFPLLLFCHRSPIDREAGFHPLPTREIRTEQEQTVRQASGTEDLLLFRDIVESVTLALPRDGRTDGRAERLASALHQLRLHEGRLTKEGLGVPLFRQDSTGLEGQRHDGTGEHVVLLRPVIENERVMARAIIEVWQRAENRVWRLQGEPLDVAYDDPRSTRGRFNHGK